MATKRKRPPKTLNWDISVFEGRDRDLNTAAANYEYVTTPAQIDACRRQLWGKSHIGLDIETSGYVPDEQGELPKNFGPADGCVRLIQIAIDEPMPRQWVIDCFKVDPLPVLEYVWGTSRNPRWNHNLETVIHYAWFEQEWLAWHYGVKLGKIFDTCAVARKLNKFIPEEEKLVNAKLDTVSEIYVGVELDKTQQTSYWDQPELNEEQIAYAALDAAVLLDIFPIMKTQVVEYGLEGDVDASMRKMMQAGHWLDKKAGKREDERDRVLRALGASDCFEETKNLQERLGQIILHHQDRFDLMQRCYKLEDKQLKQGLFSILDVYALDETSNPF